MGSEPAEVCARMTSSSAGGGVTKQEVAAQIHVCLSHLCWGGRGACDIFLVKGDLWELICL